MWKLLIVGALIAGATRSAAADCDDKAKAVYSRDEQPLGTANPARTQTFTIRASGAWTRHTERAVPGSPAKIDDEHGCLAAPRMKLVDGAVAKAQWKTVKAVRKCRVAPFSHVVYAAPAKKKSIAHDEPCGDPFDAGTATLISCAEASIDPALKDDDVEHACGL
ncbi:MAG TPA: hypothetical protein VL463_28975 [Kofleriaceae bacterium]|nr:hypothetical protein [Kofleriaceae bacterium]